MVGKLGAETGDFGVFVGGLQEGEDTGSETSKGENSEDDDDGEEFVFRLMDFGFHDG